MPTPRSPFTLRAALARQRVLVTALVLLTGCIGIGALHSASLAGQLVAVLLVVLAVLRLAMPTARMGALAVRSRGVDASVMAVIGVALAVLSTSPNL
jgi:hypothetical protein